MQVEGGEYKQERRHRDFLPTTRVKWLAVLFQPPHRHIEVLCEGELVLSWEESYK